MELIVRLNQKFHGPGQTSLAIRKGIEYYSDHCIVEFKYINIYKYNYILISYITIYPNFFIGQYNYILISLYISI